MVMVNGTENAAATKAVDEIILKPRTDKREYRRIVLKNSLQVLLISDPEMGKCAASMNVSVGWFSDPEGLEGLAHFLEHMLFYASEKYPLEGSYSKYITEHGGSRNAYTSEKDTYYYFDINSDSFDEALDSNVTALIDMKLEKCKNLSEESWVYWSEIQSGTLKFNRMEVEVAALRELKKEELIDFFDQYIKFDAPKKRSLSICVYGSKHLKEMESDKDKVVSPFIEIEDIVSFRKSQPLYGSLKGFSQLKL